MPSLEIPSGPLGFIDKFVGKANKIIDKVEELGLQDKIPIDIPNIADKIPSFPDLGDFNGKESINLGD